MKQAFALGVTGHRDIHPQVYQKVKAMTGVWLDDLLSENPAEKITFLSPLAAGADQLVAELALERGISLHVPLPFPLERYIQDFHDEEREKFTSLYKRAAHIYVPELAQRQNDDASSYFAVGAHVAQHSDLLFALWNGKKSPEKTGGTAHIVRCQLQGFPNEFLIHDAIPTRETVWIHTQRTGDSMISANGTRLTNELYQQLGKEENNGS